MTNIQIDDLWDAVNGFNYNKEEFVKDLVHLLDSKRVKSTDLIIDSCAGSGFPAIGLARAGYNIVALDGTQRMIELYAKKASQHKLNSKARLLKWSELPERYGGKAKFMFCRGNSLIYAGNSWGQDSVDTGYAYSAIQDSLRRFYLCLLPGGILYVDKFNKDEVPKEAKKGRIELGGKEEDLIWRVEHDIENHVRRWTLIRQQLEGARIEYPNQAYFLMYEELRAMLYKAGFSKVEEVKLDSEKNFTVMLAYK